MADKAKSVMDRVAGLFNQSEEQEAEQPGSRKKVADDVPGPNPTKAAEFVKGTSQKPDYLKNLKEGLGLK